MTIGTRLELATTICLVGLMIPQPSSAGNLDRCDLARISAHNTIMDTYSHVASELARMISAANAARTDRTREAYTDDSGGKRFVDRTSLDAVLTDREAADLGQADKDVAAECDRSPDELEGAVRAVVALARRDISAVLAGHLTGVALSRLLPRS